ncbi:MAG: D-alanyl-D-alanine carboxypeptidase family protein, partial [Acutalibacteraceae bacterium]
GRIIVDPTNESWNLVVVNAGREIPNGYQPKLAEILNSGKYLDYRVAPYYEKMYSAAKKDGITLTPYSAYRSYDRQKRNYEKRIENNMKQYGLSREEAEKEAATVILPPGTSEHNLGIAVDICNTKSSFASSKEYAWLQMHAHEYGFILRYTAEKQAVTGIIPEPWHWRYVGVEYAKKIKDSGLCLEEYLDAAGISY